MQSKNPDRPRRSSSHGEWSHALDDAGAEAGASLTAIVVFVALSVHSVLAGLPLGAQGSTPSAYGLFVAIMAHKSLAAFALGSNFVAAREKFSLCAIRGYLLGFAFMTPLGIGAGWLVASVAARSSPDGSGSAGDEPVGLKSCHNCLVLRMSTCLTAAWVPTLRAQDVGEDSATVGILSALASGTFLYVSTMELLPDALATGARSGHRLSTNCAICVGAIAFGSLARWT